jgi:hypothetical protein
MRYQTNAKTTTPPKMTIDQLKDLSQLVSTTAAEVRTCCGDTHAAVGFGAAGKNKNVASTASQHNEERLIQNPALPRLKRDGGRGSPRSRFAKIVPMQRMYVTMRATLQIDKMMLKLSAGLWSAHVRSVKQRDNLRRAAADDDECQQACGGQRDEDSIAWHAISFGYLRHVSIRWA